MSLHKPAAAIVTTSVHNGEEATAVFQTSGNTQA